MHRAALSNESAPKFFENGVDGYQDAPELVRELRVVRFVGVILGKRDRIRNFVRRGMDLYVQSERVKRAHNIAVEIRDSSWREFQSLGRGIAGSNIQFMGDKIELHLES